MKNHMHSKAPRHRLAKTVGGTLVVTAIAALSVSPAFADTTTTAEEETTTTTEADTTTTEADTSTTTAAETTTTADTDSGEAPAGGADTGAGGTASDNGLDPSLAVGGVLGLAAVGAGGTYMFRRRKAAIEA